jgi:iron complex outermembrane receptor protein
MARIILFFVLSLFFEQALSQSGLRGVVYDAGNKQTIASASIYFPELHYGCATAADGSFDISLNKSGHFLLQVSHLGYENVFVRVMLPQDSVVTIFMQPSELKMREVVVTGSQSLSPRETSFNTAQLSAIDMHENGSVSLSDAIARLPGISQLTTGIGISKPVIRGLSGNRIQVNVNGMRFDNQQWQDEHGLGLSDMGIDRVEIIKGPASILYGSDAMGGVLNVIEEKPAAVNEKIQDANVRLYSNTYGVSAQYGVKKTTAKNWWRLRAGIDNHADYGNKINGRVLNSRFASYNLKASLGFNRKNRVSVNNLVVSQSKFGFIFDSLSRKEEDGRLSRTFDGPHHQVFFVQGTSENAFYRPSQKIKLNAGFLSNLRQEDEGGGGISLSMLLNSFSLLAQAEQSLSGRSELVSGLNFFAQSNKNYGGRVIVPDALIGDASAFSLYRLTGKTFLFEGGFRYNFKFIGTYATNSLNVIGNESPSTDIVPFNQTYHVFNATAGTTIHITEEFDFKANGSSGYRPGNLAELSSNGLHEGTLRWEIGKPDAKIEKNVNIEGSLLFSRGNVRTSVSLYRNRFFNYIYLAPTGQEYFGFQIYRFQQSDATLQGGEVEAEWNPLESALSLLASYSFISAKKDDRSYLPFIPANKINGEVKFRKNVSSMAVGGTYVFEQNRPAEFESYTPGYFLLYTVASATWKKTRWSLTCNNLLNKTYYDHLSRLKYYGVYNMGRNVVLGVTIQF